jgi:hypothetical protein
MEKHGRARQATDDNIIWCIKVHSACQITMALTEDTHTKQYLILITVQNMKYFPA